MSGTKAGFFHLWRGVVKRSQKRKEDFSSIGEEDVSEHDHIHVLIFSASSVPLLFSAAASSELWRSKTK